MKPYISSGGDTGVFCVLFVLLTVTPASKVRSVTFPLPSHCPTRCGNISIPFPFGIGEGCFRSGLDLTCDNSANPPRLFLGNSTTEVVELDISNGRVKVRSKIFTMNSTTTSYKSSLNIDLNNRPYALAIYAERDGMVRFPVHNELRVVGCSINAYLMDLNKNPTASSCSTVCPGKNSSEDYLASCNGIGCCAIRSIDFFVNQTSVGILLTRVDPSHASIKAFLTNRDNSMENVHLGISGSTEIHTTLGWYVNHQSSCSKAIRNKGSYACLSTRSSCWNAITSVHSLQNKLGYTCQCSPGYHGNPYLPNGCRGPLTRLIPASNCTRKCGETEVPFPFGLEEGCYRDETFSLSCNHTSHGSGLFISGDEDYDRGWSRVIYIWVDEGKLQVCSNTTGSLDYNYIHQEEEEIYKWVIDYMSCDDATQNKAEYACQSNNSYCKEEIVNSLYNQSYLGYRCKCAQGFEGNPYMQNGCKDIDECLQPDKYVCQAKCVNYIGGYSCRCWPGTSGDPKRGCIYNERRTLLLGLVIGTSIGVGFILISLSCVFINKRWKKTKQRKIRRKFFCLNHGLLLEQMITSTHDATQKTKIYSLEELENATNNFDDMRILGSGGHGTVYKGILLDQHVVAIKKSKITKKSEIREFINEVFILSQLSHRNVVRLYGCCLETEVPILVYEFVSKGTLYDHLHSVNDNLTLPWEDRLRIATESAGALAYLHSAASLSIFHRDVKSSNILLDDYLNAKVSDFGASRALPPGQTHIVTAIQGTFGYLDPEYYQTSHLTEKSDVYSFGVILLELLTGKKPILFINGESMSLAMYFFQAIEEKQPLELVDTRIAKEVSKEELGTVIQVVQECLTFKGKERPTMKEVEFNLKGLRKAKNNQKQEQNGEENRNGYLPIDQFSKLRKRRINNEVNRVTRNSGLEIEFMSSIKNPQ